MKVRLLIISETLIDGVGKHIIDLLTNLDQEKFDIHVFHSSNRIDEKFKEAKQRLNKQIHFYQIEELHREIGFYDAKAFVKIYKLMKNIKPNIVHCHSSKAGVLGRLSAKLQGINQCYYTPHAYAIQNNQLGHVKKTLYTWVERFLGNQCTSKTINISVGENKFALQHKLTTKDKSTIIYNCIQKTGDLTEWDIREELGVPIGALMVGCVARIYEQKNPYEFIEIAKRVLATQPDTYFMWIGNGEYKDEVEAYVKKEKLTNSIHFIGYRKNVDDYLEALDVYLSTSLYEGMPYTVIEALRSGCPCVVSNVVGNNELVEEDKCGYLYPLGNVEHASLKIIDLLSNEDKRVRFSAAAVKSFNENYTLDKMILSHEHLYLKS
jgi:glycosyltransferase involved in cell wall biosynthesis